MDLLEVRHEEEDEDVSGCSELIQFLKDDAQVRLNTLDPWIPLFLFNEMFTELRKQINTADGLERLWLHQPHH